MRTRIHPIKHTGAAVLLLVAFAGAAAAQDGVDVGTPGTGSRGEATLRFNFRDAPLDTVLDYLSETAGFIIVREVPVEGRVDVVSHQPLTADEAVNLLNTVLNERGYAALRSDRTLIVVKREDATKRNIPVKTGRAAEAIPTTDEMITQIIPVRHANATQLLANLQPLLPSYAVASANESSNAIVLTDTQANIRRMVQIVEALDTSIAAISDVKVYALLHAKAEDVARLVNSVFENSDANQSRNARNMFRRFFPGGRDGGDGGNDGGDSAAREAASRVQAVGDERTNSLVVSAPADLMPLIDTIIEEIDRVSPPATEIRVFPLMHADSDEMAQIINSTFETTNRSAGSQNTRQGRRFFGGGPGQGGRGQEAAGTQSDPAETVRAVSDYRTNSVVVTAETSLMDEIARMIEQLDGDPSREQKVFVYKLQNADPEEVAAIVQGLFPEGNGGATRAPSRNTGRNTTGRATTGGAGVGIGSRTGGSQNSSRFGQ